MKLLAQSEDCATEASPPARGRGLKLNIAVTAKKRRCRPPRGGVD